MPYNSPKRKEELDIIINSFIEKVRNVNSKFELKPDHLNGVMKLYEIILNEGIKPSHLHNTNISIFKVAASYEIVINYFKPIQFKEEGLKENLKNTQKFNADLGFYVAFQLIVQRYSIEKDLTNLKPFTDIHKKIIKKHLTYNYVSETRSDIWDYTVLQNSIFWETFYALFDQSNG